MSNIAPGEAVGAVAQLRHLFAALFGQTRFTFALRYGALYGGEKSVVVVDLFALIQRPTHAVEAEEIGVIGHVKFIV